MSLAGRLRCSSPTPATPKPSRRRQCCRQGREPRAVHGAENREDQRPDADGDEADEPDLQRDKEALGDARGRFEHGVDREELQLDAWPLRGGADEPGDEAEDDDDTDDGDDEDDDLSSDMLHSGDLDGVDIDLEMDSDDAERD